MVVRRYGAAFSFVAALALSGCSVPVGLYHDVEGGAISKTRQPPPGMNLPYPNLANVPPPVQPAAPGTQAAIAAQAHSGVSAPSAAALAGLTLPQAVPPLPDVPGLTLPATPTPVPPPAVAEAPPPPPKPPGPPITIGFPPKTALLPFAAGKTLAAVAAGRGDATVIAGGFGDGSLPLALARARRLADALTAAGVPPGDIRLTAAADGSGGFVQLVY